MSWWLIVRRDGVPHCWDVGDTGDEARTRDVVDRARVLVGFPAGDDWISDPLRRDVVQLTLGEPHPTLMAQATVHQLSDLDSVTPQQLATYRAQGDTSRRQERMRAAREQMLRLSSDERAEVIAGLPGRPDVRPGT